MNVDSLMFNPGSDIYYDAGFRVVLEDHMTLLRNDSTTQIIDVAPMDAYVYEADLFGLLSKYGVAPYLHWLTMRMNDMTSPSENDLKLTQLLIPYQGNIDKIRQSYTSVNRIT
jgi:hypothetical protein